MVYGNSLTTEIYEDYKSGNTDITKISEDELSTVNSILHRRLIKDVKLYKFREACKKEISRRRAIARREQRIKEELVPQLNNKLVCAYDISNFLHLKLMEKMKKGAQVEDIEDYLRDAGRTIGSKLYDLPSIQTGLYSVDALRNIKKYKSAKDRASHNTNEHFFSLYANAGPFILRKAIIKTLEDEDTSYTFKLFVRMVSRLNQTIKTTNVENNRLQKYHSFNTMIGVQHSYEQAEVSQLVDCGINTQSEIYLKWLYMCESQGLPLKIDAGKHFNHIMSLEEAIDKFPELNGVERYILTK